MKVSVHIRVSSTLMSWPKVMDCSLLQLYWVLPGFLLREKPSFIRDWMSTPVRDLSRPRNLEEGTTELLFKDTTHTHVAKLWLKTKYINNFIFFQNTYNIYTHINICICIYGIYVYIYLCKYYICIHACMSIYFYICINMYVHLLIFIFLCQ